MRCKRGEKTFIQKLRFFEDEQPDFVTEGAELMLRLKLRKDMLKLINKLKTFEVFDPEDEDDSLCFNFDLSFYAHEEVESTMRMVFGTMKKGLALSYGLLLLRRPMWL